MVKYKVKIRKEILVVGIRIKSPEKLDEKKLNIFSQMGFKGLMEPRAVKKNYIEYSCPRALCLADELKKPMDRYDFFCIIEQILDLVKRLSEIKEINSNLVLFDLNRVFITENTKEIQLIYLPLCRIDKKVDMLEFIREIISCAKPVISEGENNYLRKFKFFLDGIHSFDAGQIEDYIFNEEKGLKDMFNRPNTERGYNEHDINYNYDGHNKTEYMPVKEKKPHNGTEFMPEKQSSRRKGTVFAFENVDSCHRGTIPMPNSKNVGATGAAPGLDVSYAKLCRIKTGEVIIVNKEIFLIGQRENSADYGVYDNDAVSGRHAEVIRGHRTYFIKDLNSSNGTFVNNQEIRPYQEIEINNNDSLKLADEEFIFYVEN